MLEDKKQGDLFKEAALTKEQKDKIAKQCKNVLRAIADNPVGVVVLATAVMFLTAIMRMF